jgi:hypothetical protein
MRPKEALAVLVAAFSREKIEPVTVGLYVEKIKDIPPDVLAVTVNRLVETAKYFPAIAEIRETAAKVCGRLPASPAEALGIIRKASIAEPKYDRAGRYCYTEYSWEWPKMSEATAAAVRDCLQRCGDPVDGNGKEKFGWETGFTKTYETVYVEHAQRALANLSQASLPAPGRKSLTSPATAIPIASGSTGTGVEPSGRPSGQNTHAELI